MLASKAAPPASTSLAAIRSAQRPSAFVRPLPISCQQSSFRLSPDARCRVTATPAAALPRDVSRMCVVIGDDMCCDVLLLMRLTCWIVEFLRCGCKEKENRTLQASNKQQHLAYRERVKWKIRKFKNELVSMSWVCVERFVPVCCVLQRNAPTSTSFWIERFYSHFLNFYIFCNSSTNPKTMRILCKHSLLRQLRLLLVWPKCVDAENFAKVKAIYLICVHLYNARVSSVSAALLLVLYATLNLYRMFFGDLFFISESLSPVFSR